MKPTLRNAAKVGAFTLAYAVPRYLVRMAVR
jgi:hypothetical protein